MESLCFLGLPVVACLLVFFGFLGFFFIYLVDKQCRDLVAGTRHPENV